MSEPPLLAVVTGPPAAGKTTLARRLAREHSLPLVEKDVLKELLFDALADGDRSLSEPLGRLIYDVLYDLMGMQLRAGQPLLVEANFDPAHADARIAVLPPHRGLQIYLTAPEDVLLARFEARRRHPAHRDREVALVERVRSGEWAPLRSMATVEPDDLGEYVGTRLASIPLLIVVTVPTGGETTIAEKIAERMKIPIVSTHTLEERLYQAFGSDSRVEPRIERAAIALLFSVVESQLGAGASVVAEGSFDAYSDLEPFRRLRRKYDVRIVQVNGGGDPLDVPGERIEVDLVAPGRLGYDRLIAGLAAIAGAA